MDIRKIKKLIELVEESGISELEISEGEESVRISRAAPAASFPVMQQAYAAPVQQPALSAAVAPALKPHLPLQRKSVVTSYVPQWLVLSTAPRARTRKRSSKSVRKST
jgi:biotin carboxyl carrier protein